MLAQIKARCVNKLREVKLDLAQQMDGEEWFKPTLGKLDEVIYQVTNLKAELKCADCGLVAEMRNTLPPEGWEYVDDTEAGGTSYWLCQRCAS